jgi:hypothetical protein
VPPRKAEAIAHPTAWTYWVARFPETEKKPHALVREDLVDHLDEGIASRDQQPLLPVRREVHVAGTQRPLLSAGDRLLPERLHVERRLALPVRPQHPGVEAAQQHHVPQPGALVVGGQFRHPLTDGVTVIVEHTDQLFAHQRDPLDLLVERRLLHLAGLADEAHPVRHLVATRRLRDAQPRPGSVGLRPHVPQYSPDHARPRTATRPA